MLFKEKQVKNSELIETKILSLSYGHIVVKPDGSTGGLSPASYETYQIVEPGDVIIRPTDLQNDRTSLRVGLVRDRGIITSAYLCLANRPGLLSDFGYLLLHAYDLKKVLYGLGSGLRQNLSYSDFKHLVFPVPPTEEQAAIVHYVNWLDKQVNRFIYNKRRLVALLQDQERMAITQAVTMGLDSTRRLRSVDLPWLSAVPDDWKVVPLKRYWTVTDCKHITVPFVDEGIPLASVREAKRFDLDLANSRKTTPEWYRHLVEGGRCPSRGDIIYCRNVNVGAAAFVDTDVDFAMGQDVCLIRSRDQNNRYLNYLLHSNFMAHQLMRFQIGSTFSRINVSDVKALSVLVPPRDEQDEIVKYLDDEVRRFEIPIARTLREIELIREYRARLIADVVTGQLDVRDAAAGLPDVAQSLNPLALVDSGGLEESQLEYLDEVPA